MQRDLTVWQHLASKAQTSTWCVRLSRRLTRRRSDYSSALQTFMTCLAVWLALGGCLLPSIASTRWSCALGRASRRETGRSSGIRRRRRCALVGAPSRRQAPDILLALQSIRPHYTRLGASCQVVSSSQHSLARVDRFFSRHMVVLLVPVPLLSGDSAFSGPKSAWSAREHTHSGAQPSRQSQAPGGSELKFVCETSEATKEVRETRWR